MKRFDILIVFFLFLLAAPAEYYEAFSWLEDQTLYLRHGVRSYLGSKDAAVFPYDKIVLVTIDDVFFDKYKKFPIRREDLGAIIENLDLLGAKVICVDLLFEHQGSFDGDEALSRAIKGKKVVLASRAVFDENNHFVKIIHPVPILKDSCATGYINLVSPSSVSTFISRLRIQPEATHDEWPISVQAASAYLGVRPGMKGNKLTIGDISIALNRFNEVYIDFSFLPKMDKFLHQSAGISAWEFLDISKLDKYEIMELKAWVENKIVIIGETTKVSNDWFDTPVGMAYGIEIIADTVSTLLKGAPMSAASFYVETMMGLLLFSGIVFCAVHIRIPLLQAFSAGAFIITFIVFCTFVYAYKGLVVSLTYNLMAGISGLFIFSVSSYFREKKLGNAMRVERDRAERERRTAEAATQAKNAFLANMSHEIRTPMNSAIGFMELVMEDSHLPEHHKKNLITARNSSKSMLLIINDILDISKLESGGVELENHPFELHEFMKDIIEIFELKCREKGLDLCLDIQPDLSPCYRGDSFRLRQIIINLLENAVKFTEKGSITVKAGLYDVNVLDKLHFSVADTGIGIPPHRLDKIFEPFTQADNSTSRRFGGTGLGTAISRQLAYLMGGGIWAESQEKKGSVFHFTVHLQPLPMDHAAPVSHQPLSIKNALPGPKRCFNVLVAEDIVENMTLVEIRLLQHGHHVIKACNGYEAVKKYQRESPDIILMDIQMPEMDGIEAAREIRGLEKDTRTPIVALTASLMKEERDDCLRAGMDAVVGKPLNFEELFDVMEKLVPPRAGDRKQEPNNSQAPVPAPIPDVKGVDLAKGLELWRDESAYKKALAGFCKKYRHAAYDIMECVKNGDRQGARRIAHGAKGVSANLAMTGVYMMMETLNNAVREKSPDELIILTNSLENELKSVIGAIENMEQEKEESRGQKYVLSVNELKDVFRGMVVSCEECDPDNADFFLGKLKHSFSSRQTHPIEQKLDAFEFDKATEETLRLAEELGVELGENSCN